MMWFKIICPHNKDTPPHCSLVAGCVFPKGTERATPPHCEGCHCTIEPTEQPGICDPILIDLLSRKGPLEPRYLRGRSHLVPLVIHAPDMLSPDTRERIANELAGNKNVGHFSTGVEQPQKFPRNNIEVGEAEIVTLKPQTIIVDDPSEELPRCGCSLCEKCGETVWVYGGKVGCGNRKCEDYAMGAAHKMYEKKLIEIKTNIVVDMDRKIRHHFIEPTSTIYVFHRNRKKDLWTHERTVGTEARAIERCEELKEFYKYTMYSTKLPKKYWS